MYLVIRRTDDDWGRRRKLHLPSTFKSVKEAYEKSLDSLSRGINNHQYKLPSTTQSASFSLLEILAKALHSVDERDINLYPKFSYLAKVVCKKGPAPVFSTCSWFLSTREMSSYPCFNIVCYFFNRMKYR